MNTNEVIANRAIELAGGVLGSKPPSTPTTTSTERSRPTILSTAMPSLRLKPSRIASCRAPRPSDAYAKAVEWAGREDRATPDGRVLDLGQKPGLGGPTDADLRRLDFALDDLFELALGGTAVGTGLNAHPLAQMVADEIANITGLTFCSAENKLPNWLLTMPSWPPGALTRWRPR